MGNRINWIDWAKAIGIFIVVIGHISYPEDIQYPRNIIYGFHMPFFFLVSGLLHKQENGFLKKNIQRLIIPYLLFNALIFIFFNLPNYLLGDFDRYELTYPIKNTLYGLLFPISIASWFLVALFWARVANHFLLKLRPLLAITIAILIGIVGYWVFNDINNRTPLFICQGLLATPIITVGYFIKKYDIIDLIFEKKKIVIISCSIILPIFLLLAYNLDTFNFAICNLTDKPLYGIGMAIAGCYLFIMLCKTLNNYSNRFVQQISDGTVVILAIHLAIYNVLIRLYLNIYPSSTPNIIISLAICCLIMIFCYFLIGFVQKNKVLSISLLGKSKKRIES